MTAQPRRWVRKRLRHWRGLGRAFVGLLTVAAILGVLVLIIWVLPAVLTEHPHIPSSADRQKAITDTRTGLVAVLAAIGAAGGLAYTARTYRLSREGQVTDRYSKAVEQLGNNDQIEVRIGGIYALERLMHNSPKDQPTIMETLTAFVRQRAPVAPALGRVGAPLVAEQPRPYAVDVQAVLTVLARRRPVKDERPIDLRRSHLRRAWLERATLNDAVLQRANLTDAQLSGAILTGADLSGAILTGADLSGAILTGADLRGANLTGAKLSGADLTRALVQRGTLLDKQLVSARHTDQIVWSEPADGATSP